MSGFIKTVLKTEWSVFFNEFFLLIFFFAFAMPAACKTYLAWNNIMENFLPRVSFIYLFIFHYLSPLFNLC